MINLSNLSPNKGATKQRKRLGRGRATGHGKTSGRGHKGYKARSGSGVKPGFEGGQMPIQRRLPKRGFTNIFKTEYSIINLRDLDRFDDGATVNNETLFELGMIKKVDNLVKILGDGDLGKKLDISVEKISKSAQEKIEAAGGTVKVKA